jgi:hypothetical protein
VTRERKTKTEVFGDAMLDLGKLTFAGIVLAGIFEANFNKTLILLSGIAICATFIIIGMFLVTKKTKEEKL